MDRGQTNGVGIYDRDYYRQGGSGFQLRAPRTAIGTILLLNVAVFLLELVSVSDGRSYVAEVFATHVNATERESAFPHQDTLSRPWLWWQFVTYGFTHDINSMTHIIFNMATLFFLGRDIEQWYGTREFIRLYMVMLVFASVIWAFANRLFYPGQPSSLIGASGAIAGVVVLYALHFPKRILLFMFVLPLPAWLLGALAIASDVIGAMGTASKHPGEQQIAYTAHLAGTALALAYFNFQWNFGRLYQSAANWLKTRSRPSLKVFKPEDASDGPVDDDEVDRVLAKLKREGKESLTRKERNILESASRAYQRRRRPD
jgi:membrane associated rhomboid family serine protease